MNKLKETRLKLKMSQSRLAQWLGCRQSMISKLENYEFVLSIDYAVKLKKLCELKNIPFILDDMVWETKKRPTTGVG